MADSSNEPVGPKQPQKKREISMEQRLLVAFVLMGLVLFSTQFLYPPPPEKNVKTAQQATPKQAAKPAAPEAPPAEPPAAQVSAPAEQLHTIETDVYKIVFSNRGAVVRNWILKQYKDGRGKPLDVVNPLSAAKVGYPLALVFKNQKPTTDVNQALFAAMPAPDGIGVDYEFSNGKVTARKRLRFLKNSYLAEITTSVQENGSGIPHLISWRGGFGDPSVTAAHTLQHTLYYDGSKRSLETHDADDAKDNPVTESGQFTFAGIEDAFFAGVFLPKAGESVEIQTQSTPIAVAEGGKEEPHVGVAVGGEPRNQLSLFLGPKDLDLLRRVDAKLVDLVDFGWFWFIAKPLFLALNWFNDRYVHNYGWSIVIVTVIINFLLLPLKLSSMKSMKNMQVLQPQIKAISEKYKNIGLRDPRKAQQNEETMALYKKHGVNPASGCMPLVLQIPFFFAFYKVLTVAIEMRGASWLWVSDLSQPETIAIRILPVAMIATQFFLQKMTPAATMDPAQQRIMLLMPLMMGFMFYGVASGLVLYWLTGNVVGIAQQWLFNRMGHSPVPAVIDVKPVAKKKTR